jgi:subtilisin family serine protease
MGAALLPVMAVASSGDEQITGEHQDGTVLVGFQPGTSEAQVQAVLQAAGGEDQGTVGDGPRKAQVASGGVSAAIGKLKANPVVRYAEPNYIVHADAAVTPRIPSGARFTELWGMRNTGQPILGVPGVAGADSQASLAWSTDAWGANLPGSDSVVVGVTDTGIDWNHPDLAPNIWTGSVPADYAGLTGCSGQVHGLQVIGPRTDWTCSPMDDNGHGTHVSGTIGGVGFTGPGGTNSGVAGMAWKVKMMPLKFLNAAGSGSEADAVVLIDFAIKAKREKGVNIRVLSASWGGPDNSQALADKIKEAGDNDILFVVAAGNGYTDMTTGPLHYPAANATPNMIAVAAMENTDTLAAYSNTSPSLVHLAAPGSNVLSTLPNNNYAYYSGTSMATPHVSGAAALVLASYTTPLSVSALKERLLRAVDPIPALTGKVMTGGRLNVCRALPQLNSFDGCSQQPPSLSLSLAPAGQSVAVPTPGAPEVTVSYSLTITRLGVSGLMSVSGSFDVPAAGLSLSIPATIAGDIDAAAIIVTVTSDATPDLESTFTVTITGGGFTATTTGRILVNGPGSNGCQGNC